MKKILSFLLTTTMMLSVMPSVSAEENIVDVNEDVYINDDIYIDEDICVDEDICDDKDVCIDDADFYEESSGEIYSLQSDELAIIDGIANTTLEFEDYANSGNIITSSGASGGTTNNHVRFYGSSGTQYITMRFNVTKMDYYAMTIDASTSNDGSDRTYLSDWHVTVNDETEVSVGNVYQNNYRTISGATYTATFLQSRSKLNKTFLLTEGENTITFRVTERRAGGVYAEFDCLTLTATNSLQKVSGTEATTIGNSSFAWNHIAKMTNVNAYDGTYTKFEGGGADITATRKFYVEEEGEFALNVYAAASVTNEWMSDLKFAINGDEAVTFTSANSTVEELASPIGSGAFLTKNIKYAGSILLEEGINTITFTIPKVSTYGQKQPLAFFAFDCIKLTPIQSLDGVGLSNDVYTCLVDDEFAPALVNSDGKTVPLEQFASVNAAVCDTTVARIEEDSKIVALNKGCTEFKIDAVSSDGTEYEFTGILYVTDEQGIYITDAVLDTNNITLNVASATEYAGGDKLIFAVFGMEDGRQTSLKAVYTQSLPQIGANDDKEIIQNITALGEGEFVRIFIMNRSNESRAIYSEITLGLEDAQ